MWCWLKETYFIKEPEGKSSGFFWVQGKSFADGWIDIAARVRCLANLDEFLRSDSLVFDYLDRADHCSNIKADWMIKGQALGEPCYLFLRSKEEQKKLKNRAQRDYFCLSFFPERGIEYGNNARSMNILYKQRINTETGERETLCCHPGYIPLKQRSWCKGCNFLLCEKRDFQKYIVERFSVKLITEEHQVSYNNTTNHHSFQFLNIEYPCTFTLLMHNVVESHMD